MLKGNVAIVDKEENAVYMEEQTLKLVNKLRGKTYPKSYRQWFEIAKVIVNFCWDMQISCSVHYGLVCTHIQVLLVPALA